MTYFLARMLFLNSVNRVEVIRPLDLGDKNALSVVLIYCLFFGFGLIY